MTDLERALAGDKNLTRTFLSDADLTDADLTGADLSGATLTRVKHSASTRWPEGFTPPASV